MKNQPSRAQYTYPRFETDENYSYFIVTLPIHPAFRSDEGVNGEGEVREHPDNKLNKIYSLIRDGVNDGVKETLVLLLNIQGLNATEIANRINKSIPSIERYLRILRKKEIIEFRGAPKTGGYFFTSKVDEMLNK